jgi:hypothetical protein
MADTKDTPRLVSTTFADVETGQHFWTLSGGIAPSADREHVKVDHETSRDLTTQEEKSWEPHATTTVMVEAECHRRLREGERVRVRRHTDRMIDSSRGVVDGEEVFEGEVESVTETTAFIRGDDGEVQSTSPYAGDEHGYPVIEVEVLSDETVASRLQKWNETEPVEHDDGLAQMYGADYVQDLLDDRRHHLLRIARITKGIRQLGERGVLTSARLMPRAYKEATGDVLARYSGESDDCMITLHGVESLMDSYDIDPDVELDSPVPSGDIIA